MASDPDPNMVYADFTMDCPSCGPGTVVFEGGKQKPHPCDDRSVIPSVDHAQGVANWPSPSLPVTEVND